MQGQCLGTHFLQPTWNQQQFDLRHSRGDDAVGVLTDVAVRIARVEHLEARLAVGTGSGNGAPAAATHRHLVGAAHQFQLAGIVDRRDREGVLLRPLALPVSDAGVRNIKYLAGEVLVETLFRRVNVALAFTAAWSVIASALWLAKEKYGIEL